MLKMGDDGWECIMMFCCSFYCLRDARASPACVVDKLSHF